jgi:hypothetical protein
MSAGTRRLPSMPGGCRVLNQRRTKVKKVALVAATLIAALGLTGPAVADGWGAYPPQGFPPPPSVSLFSGNAPSAFYPSTPRPVFVVPRHRRAPRYYDYGPAYTYAPGYGSPRYGHRGVRGRQVIIITR